MVVVDVSLPQIGIHLNKICTQYRLFFLTPAAEKTKAQAQNSSQKLKEKTQPQGGTFLLLRKTPEKNSFLPIYLLKLKFSLGLPLFLTFILLKMIKFYQFKVFTQ